jgi:5-hydroxytryptamine receptor 1
MNERVGNQTSYFYDILSPSFPTNFNALTPMNYRHLTVNLSSSNALSANDDGNVEDNDYSDAHGVLATVITSSILGLLILLTVVGNVFVIAAILLERNLRSVGNYLVFSLAVADLMVACMVMPLGAVYEVSGKWNLGAEMCELWTMADVLCCTASILHLLAIAIVSLAHF